MEIRKRCLIASDCRQEKLLPERGICVPAGAQLVTLLKSDALDIPGTERGDDARDIGWDTQYQGRGARVRACRVPRESKNLDAEFARRFSRKRFVGWGALRIGRGSALKLSPPLHALKSQVEEQKRVTGGAAPRGFIEPDPEIPIRSDGRKGLARSRAEIFEHLQRPIVQSEDEIECLRAGPFPGRQGIRGVVFVSGHVVIVVVTPQTQIRGLSGFVSKTRLAQRSASWKIGSEENSEDISSLCA